MAAYLPPVISRAVASLIARSQHPSHCSLNAGCLSIDVGGVTMLPMCHFIFILCDCAKKNTFCEKHSHVCVWCNHGSMVGSNYTNYTQNTRWSHFCRLFFLILNFTFCNAHCQNHLDPYSPNSGLCGSMWAPIMLLLRETCGSHFCQLETALFAAMSACCHFGRCDTRAAEFFSNPLPGAWPTAYDDMRSCSCQATESLHCR